jgi:hypothetical protein
MDKEKIYVDSATTNGIQCPELIIHPDINIKDQYVIHYENQSEIIYLPIKVKISYIITDAKYELNAISEEKLKINTTTKHLRLLEKLLKLMDNFNQTRLVTNEELRYLYVMDLLDDERKKVIASFEKQKINTENILKHQKANYKSLKKTIKTNSLNSVSKLLKENGLRNHRDSASIILTSNGLDMLPLY